MDNKNQEHWNGSRWEFTKAQSQWHFDPLKEGNKDYQNVCTFEGDWYDAVTQCLGRVLDSSWSSRNQLSKDDDHRTYTADAEEQDLIRAGADPKMEVFQRTKAEDFEVFQNIASYFGMEEYTIKFHNQRTGQMLNWHIDNFAGRKERGNTFTEIEADRNPELMRRFVIMLDDWKHGQVFALGNSNWHQWKRGECITWEWRDIPHATCNMGWENRPMLQVTGWTTEQTHSILNGSKETLIKV